jgi:hypothetical protein
MRAIAAGDILCLLWLAIETTVCPLVLAHRARWAAAIRARPAAEILRVPPTVLPREVMALSIRWSCEERRLRSRSSCLSTKVRLVMAGIVLEH